MIAENTITLPLIASGHLEEIDRRLCLVYRGDDRRGALQGILKALEAFAEIPANREMVCEELDRYAPELSILAGHVAAINRLEDAVADRDLDDREHEAVKNLRDQTANVWAHGRAGQILIDSLKPFRDQPAVCDPSEVVG
jgi:hypothetical protein